MAKNIITDPNIIGGAVTSNGIQSSSIASPYYSPTVVTNANTIEKTIPEIVSNANKLLPPATFGSSEFNASGQALDKNGLPYTSGGYLPTGSYDDIYKSIVGNSTEDASQTDPYLRTMLDLINSQKAKNDQYADANIQAIQQKYASKRDALGRTLAAQDDATKNALLLSGTSRYAPGSENSVLSARTKFDIESLADLDAEENQLIAQAQQARQTNDYQFLEKQLGLVETKRKEKQDLIDKVNESLIEESKKERERKMQAERDAAISSLVSQGITDPGEIMNMLNASGGGYTAKEVGDAVNSLFPGGASTTYKEYQAYVKDSKTRGIAPMSFDEYQTRDVNRKLAIANAAGLSDKDRSVALQLSNSYEARSKDYYTVRDAYNRILSSATNPSAAGDLSLIYGYMKLLDPNSVVRETEFATAQNAGSVPERVRAQWNKVLSGERLTETQRKDFIDRASRLFTSAKSQQQQIIDEYTDRAATYGVPTNLVVRSIDAVSPAQDALNAEEQARSAVVQYGQTNPGDREFIKGLVTNDDPTLGRPMTYEEAYQYLRAIGKI